MTDMVNRDRDARIYKQSIQIIYTCESSSYYHSMAIKLQYCGRGSPHSTRLILLEMAGKVGQLNQLPDP